ncbi:hypothetical protein SMICM17S_05820 [Streptomyces microflavus]
MRDAYHEELDSIGEGLVEMARLVGSAIGRATTSMLDADLKLAESVIAGDQKVDDLQHDLEARAIALLARQQPVATDLRIVVTSLRMSADLERWATSPSTWRSWPGCASRSRRSRTTCTPPSWRWGSSPSG